MFRGQAPRRERGIWQRRFWEHAIRDDADFERHVDYIYFNPVKHGYVTRVCDWPHRKNALLWRTGVVIWPRSRVASGNKLIGRANCAVAAAFLRGLVAEPYAPPAGRGPAIKSA
jgi:hypothetical protein